ncbi:hypothetical protein PoB_001819300 [Plakobranchus ocellatus]|uniref:Uncharacterized protein n=1 Tax=Plakobranchus ocellatus TaxID=259542 RepID=A0AAV3ZB88_9GAST|nr:hypothetical protein PoB_001819300 [Plakobranchus ocellatus]
MSDGTFQRVRSRTRTKGQIEILIATSASTGTLLSRVRAPPSAPRPTPNANNSRHTTLRNKYISLKILSGGSCNRAVGYQVRGPRFESQFGQSQFFIAFVCPPSTKWVARSLKIRCSTPDRLRVRLAAASNTLEFVWREPRPRQSYSSQSGGRQTDSKVALAAARQTPECIWRPL